MARALQTLPKWAAKEQRVDRWDRSERDFSCHCSSSTPVLTWLRLEILSDVPTGKMRPHRQEEEREGEEGRGEEKGGVGTRGDGRRLWSLRFISSSVSPESTLSLTKAMTDDYCPCPDRNCHLNTWIPVSTLCSRLCIGINYLVYCKHFKHS